MAGFLDLKINIVKIGPTQVVVYFDTVQVYNLRNSECYMQLNTSKCKDFGI